MTSKASCTWPKSHWRAELSEEFDQHGDEKRGKRSAERWMVAKAFFIADLSQS
jgi:hypothetical protein